MLRLPAVLSSPGTVSEVLILALISLSFVSAWNTNIRLRQEALLPFGFSARTAEDPVKHPFQLVADLDRRSAFGAQPDREVEFSYLKTGTLRAVSHGFVPYIAWDGAADAATGENFGDLITGPPPKNASRSSRGMELSDLVRFDGHLIACEDRTGIIYRIANGTAVPWITLRDEMSRRRNKGFKCEWSVVKDGHVYFGSHSASIKHPHPDGPTMWTGTRLIKKVSANGTIESVDWNHVYEALDDHLAIKLGGFMMQEAVLYSDIAQAWYFLPRTIQYDNSTDDPVQDLSPCDFIVTATEDLTVFTTTALVGPLDWRFGFSAARFVPGTNDSLILALRSFESEELFATKIVMFHLNGTIVLPEQIVVKGIKFEGLEFT
ncbi:putative Soluble calcium-activated nucleotidase 1 [Hypsibius exemplaris]|uniref:Soluble calcium-activated nucleotidase 1 n=1 Tax=Hypsibius exemplaris TaxID=2072580 RepID=A0A1W0XAN6_HYPEX|nr:putative Soluble calcium-activated nucleotidase 1 [Hypsibius exemplaris]